MIGSVHCFLNRCDEKSRFSLKLQNINTAPQSSHMLIAEE